MPEDSPPQRSISPSVDKQLLENEGVVRLDEANSDDSARYKNTSRMVAERQAGVEHPWDRTKRRSPRKASELPDPTKSANADVNRHGKRLNVRIPDDLAEIMDDFIDACDGKINKTGVVEVALRRYFASESDLDIE